MVVKLQPKMVDNNITIKSLVKFLINNQLNSFPKILIPG